MSFLLVSYSWESPSASLACCKIENVEYVCTVLLMMDILVWQIVLTCTTSAEKCGGCCSVLSQWFLF